MKRALVVPTKQNRLSQNTVENALKLRWKHLEDSLNAKKCGVERLYKDLLAGEFHPMQAGKQKEMLGNHLLGGDLA